MLKDRNLSAVNLSDLYNLLPGLLAAAKLHPGATIVKTHWQLVVEQNGDAYEIGSQHDKLESAVYYRDMCVAPRRGRRDGFSKKAVLRIFRHDVVKTEESAK